MSLWPESLTAKVAASAGALFLGGVVYHQIATYLERRRPPWEILTVDVPPVRDFAGYKARFHVNQRFNVKEQPTVGTSTFLQVQIGLHDPALSCSECRFDKADLLASCT
jgi:hypothetical protein